MQRALLAAGLASWAQLAAAEPGSEIVIAGHKSTRPAREVTLAASRIDAQELGRPGASAAAVLSHVPGVQVSSTGASSDFASVSLRGASSAQTPVYLAGIRLNDDLTGSADLSLIPLWMLNRAEVYRGNAPADAERMGIGGAIYFEPRLPHESRLLAGANVGSFGEHGGYLGAEVAQRGAAALVAFRTAQAQNDYPYLNDGDTAAPNDDRVLRRSNADSSERDAWAIGRTALAAPGAPGEQGAQGAHGAQLITVFNAFEREQGVTGLAAVPALAARAKLTRLLAGVSARVPCSAAKSCEASLSTQLNDTHSRLLDPQSELGLSAARLDLRGTRVAQSAALSFGDQPLHAVLGAHLAFERLAVDGDQRLRANRSTSSARVALTAALSTDSDLASLAVLTCDRTQGPAQVKDCRQVTPEGRLGVRQRFGALELRSNLSRYVRVPTLGELYGVSAAVRGSSALIPERGLSWDAGARAEQQLGSLWIYGDVFGFVREVSELIAYRRSSQAAAQPYNVGSARVLGAEIEAGAEWPRHLRAVLTLTLLDPRNTSTAQELANDLIPYQSRLSGGLFVESFSEPWVHGPRLGFDARLSHQSSRLADPAGLVVLPASTALDLGASLAITQGAEWSVRGAIDDVFDARRFDFIGYPLPGRSVHVALEARY